MTKVLVVYGSPHGGTRGRRILPAGDFRDWPAVGAWAREIAAELKASPVPVA